MMKSLALFAVALLLLVPVAGIMTTKNAYAQTGSYGQLKQALTINYSDGSHSSTFDTKTFLPADIAGVAGRTVVSVTIQLTAQLPSTTDTISYSGTSMTASVLRPDGTYANVPFTPSVSDYNVQLITPGQYTLYMATIPVSAIQSAIGNNAPSDFQSEIRVVSGTNSAVYGKIGGVDRGLFTTQTVTVFTLIDNPSSVTIGGIDNTGGSGSIGTTQQDSPPHGKIYSVVRLDYTDGNFRVAVTNSGGGINLQPVAPFSISAGQESKLLSKVTYTLMMHVDSDNYVPGQQLVYTLPGATDNFKATVDNANINKVPSSIVQRQLSPTGGEYQLLSMVVTAQDLENAVKLTGQSTVNGQNFQYGFGTLTFYNRASTITMSSAGKTYTVNVPEQTTTVDLQRSVLTAGGSCEINGSSCNQTNSGSGPDMNTILLIGGVAGAGIIGVGVATKKRRK